MKKTVVTNEKFLLIVGLVFYDHLKKDFLVIITYMTNFSVSCIVQCKKCVSKSGNLKFNISETVLLKNFI